jgi:small-conductance mechanosensitive channel
MRGNIGLLLASTAVLLVATVAPRLRARWPTWQRIGWRTGTFLVLTLLVQRLLGSPVAPVFESVHRDLRLWEQLVEASWWLLAGRVAVGIARAFVVVENRPRETRIVSDLLAGAIYVAVALAIVSVAFSIPIEGLLATSGIVAIVLGLALQSTLSDVFSGIAVGIEKPYKVGDLLWVEGGIEGRVIQVNWRSTQIGTVQDNVAIVPNSIIAKARLVNRSAPTPRRAGTVTIRLDARADPDHCLATLTAAVRACRLVLAEPAPTVACTGLQGDGVDYEVSFSVTASDLLIAARTELYARIHRHLRHEGIALAISGARMPLRVEVPSLAGLLERSDLFGVLGPAHRERLGEYFTAVEMQTGEVLMRKGEVPETLFVIASGTVEITLDRPDGPQPIHWLSPGETLGAAQGCSTLPEAALSSTFRL